MVDIIFIHWQPGEAGPGKQLCNFLFVSIHWDSYNINSWGEYIACLQLREFNGAADQGSFLLVDPPALLGLVYNGKQLFFRNSPFIGRTENGGQQLFPLPKQEVGGGKYFNKDIEEGGGQHGEALRRFLGNTFWRYLPEYQDYNSSYHGGDAGSGLVTQKAHEDERGQGGAGNIHNIVANQNCGEHTVVVLRQLQDKSGPFVPLFRHVLYPDTVKRRKCRLRGGKIG